MIPQKMDLLLRCNGGGGGAPKPKPIPPPSPTFAAENVAKNRILDRQRNARGYSSTLLATLVPKDDNRTFLKKLLGE